MNEEALKKIFAGIGGEKAVGGSYEQWRDAIATAPDAQQKIFDNIGGEKAVGGSFADWQGAIFGAGVETKTPVQQEIPVEKKSPDQSSLSESVSGSVVPSQEQQTVSGGIDGNDGDLWNWLEEGDQRFLNKKETAEEWWNRPVPKEGSFQEWIGKIHEAAQPYAQVKEELPEEYKPQTRKGLYQAYQAQLAGINSDPNIPENIKNEMRGKLDESFDADPELRTYVYAEKMAADAAENGKTRREAEQELKQNAAKLHLDEAAQRTYDLQQTLPIMEERIRAAKEYGASPQKQAELIVERDNYKSELSQLQSEWQKSIDDRLVNYGTTLEQVKGILPPEEYQRAKNELAQLSKFREGFFNKTETEQADAVNKFIGPTIEKYSWIPKDATPQEKMELYLASLQKEYNDIHNRVYGEEGISSGSFLDAVKTMPIASMVTGGASRDENRLRELKQELEILTPIVLLNRNPLLEEKQSSGGIFMERMVGGITGTPQLTQKDQINAVREALNITGVKSEELTPGTTEGLEQRGKYEPWSAEAMADMAGSTTGFIVTFLPGGPVTKLALGGTRAYKTIELLEKEGRLTKAAATTLKNPSIMGKVVDKTVKAGNYVWTKAVQSAATGLKQGIQYEVSGILTPHSSDEANFMSGFLGGAIGNVVASSLYDPLKGLFGKEVNKAVRLITQRGAGEMGEEFAQEMYQAYKASDGGKSLWEIFKERFPTASDLSFFAFSTFVLGTGMNIGEISQANSASNDLLNASSETLNNLPEDQQQIVKEAITEFTGEQKEIAGKVVEEAITQSEEKPETEEIYDRENIEGVPSEGGIREESIEVQPIEGAGRETIGTDRDVQAHEEQKEAIDEKAKETAAKEGLPAMPAEETAEDWSGFDEELSRIQQEFEKEQPTTETPVTTIETPPEEISTQQASVVSAEPTEGLSAEVAPITAEKAAVTEEITPETKPEEKAAEPQAEAIEMPAGSEVEVESKRVPGKKFKYTYDGKNWTYTGSTGKKEIVGKSEAEKLTQQWQAENTKIPSITEVKPPIEAPIQPLESQPKSRIKQKKQQAINEFKEAQVKSIKGGKLSMGFDPDLLKKAVKAGFYIAADGVVDFADFSAKMVNQLGENVKPYLKYAWTAKLPAFLDQQSRSIEEVSKAPTIRKKEVPGSRKRRKFIKRYKNAETVSKQITETVPADTEFYEPIRHETTIAETKKLIRERGFSNAVNDYFNPNVDLEPRQRVSLGIGLLNILNSEFKKTEDDKIKEQIRKIEADIAVYGTKLGQGADAFRLFDKLSPETIGVTYQRIIESERKEKLKNSKPLINKVKSEAIKLSAKAASDAASDEKADKILEKHTGKKESRRKESVQKAIDWLESLKIKGAANAFGLSADIFNLAVSAIQKALKAGVSLTDSIEAGLNVIRDKHKGTWDREGFITTVNNNIPSKELNAERVVKTQIKELKYNLRQLAYKHYSLQEEGKKELSKKIVESLGLDPEVATELAAHIKAQVEKQFAQAKDKALYRTRFGKMFPKSIRKKKELDSEIDKLINASNAGVLTDRFANQILGNILSIPEVNEDQRSRLVELSEKIQSLPENSRERRNATQDLLTEMAFTKGIIGSDIAWALWYAGVLSGPKTHTLNLISNLYNIFAETYVSFIQALKRKDPKAAMMTMVNIFTSLPEAITEAINILKTGYQTGKYGEEIGGKSPLENLKDRKRLVRMYGSAAKYVFRMLAASDMLAYTILRNQHMYNSARFLEKEAGVYGKQLTKLSLAKIAADKETRALLWNKAVEENDGKTGLQTRLKYYDLLNRQRDESIAQEANTFASRGTFNYEPEGVLGVFHQLISLLTQIVPKSRVIFSFTKIMTNFLNQQLDWVPGIGHARALGYKLNKPKERAIAGPIKFISTSPETQQQYERLLIKATSGMGIMAAVWILTGGDDDEDSPIKIHGRGPNDYKLKSNKMEEGWLPYSIQFGDGDNATYVSYQYTPFAFVLGLVGNFRDGLRYGEIDDNDLMNRVGYTIWTTMRLGFESSVASQMNTALEIMSSKEDVNSLGDKFYRFAARTATSVIPNAFRTVDEVFDPSVYKAETFYEYFIQNIPVARRALDQKFNALGQPIEKENTWINTLTAQKLISGETDDPVWSFLGSKDRVKIPVPREPEIKGVEVPEDVAQKYIIEHGKLLYSFIKAHLRSWEHKTAEEISEILKEFSDKGIDDWMDGKSAKNIAKERAAIAELKENAPDDLYE